MQMSVWSLKKRVFFGSKIAGPNRRQPRAGDAEKKTRCQVLVCARQPPQTALAVCNRRHSVIGERRVSDHSLRAAGQMSGIFVTACLAN
jgi:hypothetical protein